MKSVLIFFFCALTLRVWGQPANLGGVDSKYVWDFVAVQGKVVYLIELSASQIAVCSGSIAVSEDSKSEHIVLVCGRAKYECNGDGFVVVSGDVRIEIRDVRFLSEDWCLARLVSIQQGSETIAREQIIHAKLTDMDLATSPAKMPITDV